MYTMTINSNNSTKTYRTLTAAQEAAENVIFAGLIWERFEACLGPFWLGFEIGKNSERAAVEICEHGIRERMREALHETAEWYVGDSLAIGDEPSGRDADKWTVMDLAALLEDADLPCEGEYLERAKDVLAELIDEIAWEKRGEA